MFRFYLDLFPFAFLISVKGEYTGKVLLANITFDHLALKEGQGGMATCNVNLLYSH